MEINRGGFEDTAFEAKDSKKIRGQGQGPTFRGQTFSRTRTGMVEAKDRGHKFSKLWLANFSLFLSAKVFKVLHFVKFLMIIQK